MPTISRSTSGLDHELSSTNAERSAASRESLRVAEAAAAQTVARSAHSAADREFLLDVLGLTDDATSGHLTG